MDTRYVGDNLLALGNARRPMTAAEEEAYYARHVPHAGETGRIRRAVSGLIGFARAVGTPLRERRAAPSAAAPFRPAPGR